MSGQIPQSFIADLLAKTDIVDVIGTRISLRRAGANFVACCPFHQEKTPSFTVSAVKQFYHCFGCAESGDAIHFLTEYEGLSFVEAIEVLASRAGLTVPTDEKDKTVKAKYTAIYQAITEASAFYQGQLRRHPTAPKVHDYLKNRGVTGEIAKAFSLGFAPPGWDTLTHHFSDKPATLEALLGAGLIIKKEGGGYYDRFRDRILFPIHDRRGRVVGFGGRVMDPKQEPKYLNSPETAIFNKRNELYGLFEARKGNRSLSSLLVVEGYMDVVSLAQFGIQDCAATLGTALTEQQVDLLFRQASELIFCFDGDKAGREAAKRSLPLILPHMKEGRRVRFIVLPAKEDPDSYVRQVGRKGFLEAIEKAVPLSDFLFNSLSANLDLHHLDSRAQLVTLAKPLLNLLPSGVFQQMLYARLAEIAGISTDILEGKTGNKNKKTWSNAKVLKPQRLPPTPAFQATAMLLEERGLISRVGEIDKLRNVDMPGANLLCAIIEILSQDTNISYEEIAGKLSADDSSQFSCEDLKMIAASVPIAGIELEFLGALQRVRERAREQVMELLLQKAKVDALSLAEKVQLKDLLGQKDKNRVD
jgi:DNA primase